MKHSIASRFVIVCSLVAALFGVALMTSEAQAQRRPNFGRPGMVQQGGYYGGGYHRNDVRREVFRREAFRRAATRGAPQRWGNYGRYGRPAPRWQAPRGRFSRGRW